MLSGRFITDESRNETISFGYETMHIPLTLTTKKRATQDIQAYKKFALHEELLSLTNSSLNYYEATLMTGAQ
jgi:hypothetical protein